MRSLPIFFFITCSLILFAILSPLQGQTLKYGIYRGEDQIGKLTVEKTVSDNKIQYLSNSESHFRLLFDNEFLTRSRADFVANEMVYCMSKTIHNGKVKEHATTQKNKDGYSLFKHPKEKDFLKQSPVNISTLTLYFAEPIGISRVFSENYQTHCPVKPLGKNTYEVTLPGGKINHYIYRNGKLVEIKVFRTLVDLSFRLQDHSG